MGEQESGEGDGLRVLIVSENASTKFGGEAILPWHYFRILRSRGIEAWLVVHSRTRDELVGLLPDEAGRMYFMPDSTFNKLACKLSRYIPDQLSNFTFGYASRLSTQWTARKLVRRLVTEKRVDVVHQPIPVSPRETSLMYNMGAPVVIGPMNGNMSFPPAFTKKVVGPLMAVGRYVSNSLHHFMPGKLRASALLVANERTRQGLPPGVQGEVITLVENGVDLGVWSPYDRIDDPDRPTKFIFLGRLVDWKAIDLLLEAFARVNTDVRPRLEILGDGTLRETLEAQTDRLRLSDRVVFSGWQPQVECARRLRDADVLVLPSLYECGGAVVLEAMACGIPVVSTAWGGPIDYLDETCGILVPPDSPDAVISGLAEAMTRLSSDSGLRKRLGRAGRGRVERAFDWEHKVDLILDVYRRVAAPDGTRNSA
ncbi:glycosyltransferase family 4 protein [Singulisphaera sp. Ch08]|uniref:Glycosyltransferase family 4 protein n=1 Tax=Singulisphaera sp. Ch08 TaxID=3120278 RepID=A0AAU7CEG5_9BACT